jgi:sarcosine oxidase
VALARSAADTMRKFDVIVVGLGAVGSAAVHHLARCGASVLGIDRFSPPHRRGSSHGETRITRVAVGEGDVYSPLALRSHALWRAMERETGRQLMVRCGCLTISGPGSTATHGVGDFLANIRRAATAHHIPHEAFADGAAIRRRFPQFHAGDTEEGFLDHEGGYLFPERCVAAQLELAKRYGATLVTNRRVVAWKRSVRGVIVRTAAGGVFHADHVLITAGAWLPRLVGSRVAGALTVTRQVLHWFEIRTNAERFAPDACPVFIWELPCSSGARTDVYGFPLTGPREAGIKIAHEESGGIADPDRVSRSVTADEIAHMYRVYVEPFFPDLGPRSIRTEVCLYTRAPEARFVIDAHPHCERVLFASACSGHGFKHSAALGEALAEILTQGRSAHVDLAPFRLRQGAW